MDKQKEISTATMKIAHLSSQPASPYPCGNRCAKIMAKLVCTLSYIYMLTHKQLQCTFLKIRIVQAPRQLLICLMPVLAANAVMAADDATMEPFEVEYSVGNNLITAGSAKLSLKQIGDEWIYSLSTLPSGIFKLTGRGSIQELSVLEYSNNKLITKRYAYRQDQEAKRSVDAWFDWEKNELTYRNRGEEVTKKVDNPLLDRLSATLSIRAQLRAGFEEVEIQVFDGGEIKSLVFENEGTETVNTLLGKQQAIKVKSYNRDGSRKRMTTTWFAPELNYVPVIIEQHKQGKLVARLTISKLNR